MGLHRGLHDSGDLLEHVAYHARRDFPEFISALHWLTLGSANPRQFFIIQP
jgi:hypothetical protein